MASESETLLIILQTQDDATEGIDELKEKLDSLGASIDELADRMDDASVKMSAALDAAATDISAAMDGASEDFSLAADRIIESMGKMDVSADATAANMDAASDSMKKLNDSSNNAADGMKNAESGASDLAGKIRLIVLALGAVAGPLEGILALTPVAMFGAMAAGGYELSKSLSQAAASGQQLTATQQAMLPLASELQTAFSGVWAAVGDAFTGIMKQINALAPDLNEAGQALIPMIEALGGGLGTLLQNLIPPLAAMMKSLLPVVDTFAIDLGQLGNVLAKFLTSINTQSAVNGLNALFNVIGQVLSTLGQFLSALAPLSIVILNAIVPALSTFINALTPVINALGPVLGPIANTIASLVGTFGDLLAAAAPLIKPLLSIVLAFSNFDTALEALDPLFKTLSSVLKPIIDLIGKIANIVSDALNTALTDLAQALIPILPALGQLVQTGLNLVIQALDEIIPLIQPFLGIFTALAPLVGQLVVAFADWAQAGLMPIIQFLGDFLRSMIPLIPPMTEIGEHLLVMLIQMFKALTPYLGQISRDWQQLLPAFIALIPSLVQMANDFNQILISLMPLMPQLMALAEQILIPLTVALIKLTAYALMGLANGLLYVMPYVDKFTQYCVKAQDTVDRVVTDIVGAIQRFENSWGNTWDGIVEDVENFIGAVEDHFSNFIAYIESIPGRVEAHFSDTGTWLYDAGWNLIDGLIRGIEAMVGTLLNYVDNVAKSIVSSFKSVLSILSPSQVMADEVGQWIPKGIAVGIEANLGPLTSAAQHAGKVAITGAQGGITGGGLVPSLGGGVNGMTVQVDLRNAFISSQASMNQLTAALGKQLATAIGPQAGLRVKS